MVNPMAEDTKLNEDTKILDEIGDYKYGFHDARFPLEGVGALPFASHAQLGT
jgi:hypothetical protein